MSRLAEDSLLCALRDAEASATNILSERLVLGKDTISPLYLILHVGAVGITDTAGVWTVNFLSVRLVLGNNPPLRMESV